MTAKTTKMAAMAMEMTNMKQLENGYAAKCLIRFIQMIINNENKIEEKRTKLIANGPFDPFGYFRMIDQSNHGYLAIDDIFRFLSKWNKSINYDDLEAYMMIISKRNLTYDDFLGVILPKANLELRQMLLENRNNEYSPIDDQDIQENIADIFIEEIQYYHELNELVNLIGNLDDQSINELFYLIDSERKGYFGYDSLKKFLNENIIPLSKEQYATLLRRIDKSYQNLIYLIDFKSHILSGLSIPSKASLNNKHDQENRSNSLSNWPNSPLNWPNSLANWQNPSNNLVKTPFESPQGANQGHIDEDINRYRFIANGINGDGGDGSRSNLLDEFINPERITKDSHQPPFTRDSYIANRSSSSSKNRPSSISHFPQDKLNTKPLLGNHHHHLSHHYHNNSDLTHSSDTFFKSRLQNQRQFHHKDEKNRHYLNTNPLDTLHKAFPNSILDHNGHTKQMFNRQFHDINGHNSHKASRLGETKRLNQQELSLYDDIKWPLGPYANNPFQKDSHTSHIFKQMNSHFQMDFYEDYLNQKMMMGGVFPPPGHHHHRFPHYNGPLNTNTLTQYASLLDYKALRQSIRRNYSLSEQFKQL